MFPINDNSGEKIRLDGINALSISIQSVHNNLSCVDSCLWLIEEYVVPNASIVAITFDEAFNYISVRENLNLMSNSWVVYGMLRYRNGFDPTSRLENTDGEPRFPVLVDYDLPELMLAPMLQVDVVHNSKGIVLEFQTIRSKSWLQRLGANMGIKLSLWKGAFNQRWQSESKAHPSNDC